MRCWFGFRFVVPVILTVSCSVAVTTKKNDSDKAIAHQWPVSYPEPDGELGEMLQDGEIQATQDVINVIHKQLGERYSGSRTLRDAHPKSHGCVSALFDVDPVVNPQLARGVFSRGAQFKAIVRYSNGSGDPTVPDIKGDVRGMAIKLLNVPGRKLLDVESEATTQDFIMINYPVFVIADPKEYVTVIEKVGSSNVFAKLSLLSALGIKGAKLASAAQSSQIASPLQATYFTAVPYQLGVGSGRLAVRYKAEPCAINGKDKIPENTDDRDYLRHQMRSYFQRQDGCYDMYGQVRVDGSMSVEDSRDEWPSPWQKLATLQMRGKDQDIAETGDLSDLRNRKCDSLSFNPWHALPEHKPLGAMNRMRKVIYENISAFRHSNNGEKRLE